ncbi:5-(carboxyamino)imidazole ribonucleotide mutase [Candidatus Peregrinibacteria bacterium CG_4_10_14_0_2_um_filter_43_11]|nr:MAG: 5-(carboxyamino)imidazole ribonucleotide mutase [Candidatus Peregrinibacteria bacterium CG_4_10_14_0_2_um_filter_43_11]
MLVPIIMGSKIDQPHAEQIAAILAEFGVRSEMYIASAHKVPELALDIVQEFNQSDEPIVYITMAGRSNALSGFVAANSIHPVIACPPFKDKADYLVNIHSTLNMPSDTPNMTVLDPRNAALAAIRILALTDEKLQREVAAYIKAVKDDFVNG